MSLTTRFLKFAMLCAIGSTGSIGAANAAQPIRVHESWSHHQVVGELPKVDNIAVGRNGSLYVSLERSGRNGMVLRLDRDGSQHVVARGLRRPDGLALTDAHLFVTEEVERGRVIRIDLRNFKQTIVATLNMPEGIVVQADGGLIIAEDLKVGGRVVRVRPDGRVAALVVGLQRPEGLARSRDGALYVAETGTGRILTFTKSTKHIVLSGLDRPDQIAVAPDGALWITEDKERGRLLRWSEGRLQTIVSGLERPQGIAFDRAGGIYVVEQGRNRVLRVRRGK